MSKNSQRMFGLARRHGQQNMLPCSQVQTSNKPGTQSTQKIRPAPLISTAPPTSISPPNLQQSSTVGSQRNTRSKTNLSTPERSNKRAREYLEVRCPGKELTTESIDPDEEIESVMHSKSGRAGGIAIESTMLDSVVGIQSWKAFKSTIFKFDQQKLSKKSLRGNLKEASKLAMSMNQYLYRGYMLAERSTKDATKLTKTVKEKSELAKTMSLKAEEADKKTLAVAMELRQKEDSLLISNEKITSQCVELEALKRTLIENDAENERLKNSIKDSYREGREAGLAVSSIPSIEQRLQIAREFYQSIVYESLSDMKAGEELFGIFTRCWKQCRKLGFLNDSFDEKYLDPMKNDDCEVIPDDNNVEQVPGCSAEEHEFSPIFFDALAAAKSDIVHSTMVTNDTINEGTVECVKSSDQINMSDPKKDSNLGLIVLDSESELTVRNIENMLEDGEQPGNGSCFDNISFNEFLPNSVNNDGNGFPE